MKLQVVGCSHQRSNVETREQVAFDGEQTRRALARLRAQYAEIESVLLSTCNRVEFYFATSQSTGCPGREEVAEFLAGFHGVNAEQIARDLFQQQGEEAIRHLFTVAASLDSMVIGEAQILSQVKQAYDLATHENAAGPLMHSVFQAALRVAKRVARETALGQKRVSIPSVAVSDFARQLFERFDDKQVLVLGAGEMGEETLRYLIDQGARDIAIVNRHPQRAEELALRFGGRTFAWEERYQRLLAADLVVSTTGANEPIVDWDEFRRLNHQRADRPLFVLDLAVPRDFDPAIGRLPGVYLYSLDDLRQACDANRQDREKEWPKAERIIEEETSRFLADLSHRTTAPTIQRLKDQANDLKSEELLRLFNKLGDLDPRSREEIRRAFDRLVNKILHPPLESLRDEAARGSGHGLLDALKRLFQIQD